LLSKKGYDVTVLEAEPHPGGGCWTKFYGGHPYTFGPRVFFSRDEEVIRQLTNLIKIREFYTKTWTYVSKDKQLYHYPLQGSDLPLMPDYNQIKSELEEREGKRPSVEDFEEYWLSVIGPTLYEKFVSKYSKKMWGIKSNKELVAEFEWVNRGTPIRDGDIRLYRDQFQGYPYDLYGYNSYFEKCLQNCKAIFNCYVEQFDPETRIVSTSKGEFTADIIINTVYVDTLFNYKFGKLRFCGRHFITFVLPTKQAFPDDVTWIHYSGNEPYTRITEFKKITNYQADDTLLGIEIPTDENRYYPLQSKVEIDKYERYMTLYPKNFYSIGRLGSFKYKGIPDAIRDALDTVEVI